MTVSFTMMDGHLRELVERAAAVVPAASFQPGLANLQVSVRPGHIQVSGTDLDLSVITTSEFVTAEHEVTFLAPAKRLKEILKEVPPGNVTVAVSQQDAAAQVRLAAGPASWLLQVPALGFPALPELGELEFCDFNRAKFLAALKAVRFAASSDGANQGLSCVTVARQGDGSAKVTASDGARVQQAALDAFPLDIQVPAIGSPAAVDEAARLLARNDALDTASVALSGGWLVFRCGSTVFVSRRLTVKPADVESQILLPAMENKTELAVPRAALIEAVQRVRVNADSSTSAIALKLSGGKLTVLAKDKQSNSAEQSLDVPWSGPARMLVVHHRYFTEMLSAGAGAQCVLRLGKDNRKAMLFTQDDDSGVTGVVGQMSAKFLGY